ncbi:MAG: WXG100 family type VII secretion target [Anaerolineales bacterium]|nr:WXG100 family type VII secretion target [Anaerolineales bacterium]
MHAQLIQADYDHLTLTVRRFETQADQIHNMTQTVRQRVDALQRGGWLGQAANAFYREMDDEIFPALKRLEEALQHAQATTLQMSQVLREAEEGAARLMQGERSGVEGPAGDLSTVPPRIYIVNGINARVYAQTDHPYAVDDNSYELEKFLEGKGFGKDNVTATEIVYEAPFRTNYSGTDWGGFLSPVDYMTGWAAQGINTLNDVANKGFGVIEVAGEYVLGQDGYYTNETFKFIEQDLAKHPLLPGQDIVLMGHSGGGAIVSNVAGMVETRLGTDVAGVLALGSPVANFDAARPYAEDLISISHETDLVGQPYVRSNPIWTLLQLDDLINYEEIYTDTVTNDSHGSYMTEEMVVQVLRERFGY